MKTIKLNLPVAFVIIFLTFGSLEAQQCPNPRNSQPDSEFRSPFRYVIVYGASETEKYANKGPNIYYIEVLMEDQAFSEENLRCLFGLLSRRFSDRPTLYANVYTSLDAIRTPEEYEHTDLAGPDRDYYKYKYAFFSRAPNGERFTYGIPGAVKSKEVIMSAGFAPRNSK